MKILLLNHTWRKIKKLHQMKYDIVTKIDHEIETPAQSINSRPMRMNTGAGVGRIEMDVIRKG